MARIWLWAHDYKITTYPIFYLLKGDYKRGGVEKSMEITMLGLGIWTLQHSLEVKREWRLT